MLSRWQQSDLQSFLYRKYISEREQNTPEIKWIALQLKDTKYGETYGYSWQLIYKYFSGDEIPPPEFFPALFCVTRDIEIINWFLTRCDGLPLFGGDERGNYVLDGSPVNETLEISALSGELSKLTSDVLADGVINDRERQNLINKHLDIIAKSKQAIEDLKVVNFERGTKHYKNTDHTVSISK